MRISDITITPHLIAWLRTRQDDGMPLLSVTTYPGWLEVLRHDGTELSETEAAHVRGVIAAHQVQLL